MKIQLFLVVLFVSLQIGANGQCPIDQSQLLTNGGVSARNLPGYYEGQTFTAGATGLLCEIDLLMTNTMTGTGTLNIFSGSGISGTLLATESVNVNVPSGSVWQYWTISSPPSITSGSVYTFQFIPIQGGGLPDPYLIDLRDSNVYSGGYHLAFPQFDLTFRTYVNSPTSIIDIQTENNFVVYPNPFSSSTTLQTDNFFNDATLTVYNSVGQQVKQIKNIYGQTITFYRDYLTRGLHFIRLTQDNKTITTDRLIITD